MTPSDAVQRSQGSSTDCVAANAQQMLHRTLVTLPARSPHRSPLSRPLLREVDSQAVATVVGFLDKPHNETWGACPTIHPNLRSRQHVWTVSPAGSNASPRVTRTIRGSTNSCRRCGCNIENTTNCASTNCTSGKATKPHTDTGIMARKQHMSDTCVLAAARHAD